MCLSLFAGCHGAEESEVRNLLLVTLDTTRADHLGCYGHARAETPTIDELAARGVLFERCIAVSPITLPSHASILTGLYPFRHGARNNGTHYLPDEVATLAELLGGAGFATGAVVSSFVLDSRYGLDQGFDAYDDDLAGSVSTGLGRLEETVATDTARRTRRWLADRGAEPWFLWVHFFDPHWTYEAPEPFAMRHPESPYDAEIAYTDSVLGELLTLLRERGELGRTLVVLTADHGESLGEHGESTHGVFVYDTTTRVPLIVSHPTLEQGKRVAEVVSLVDVAPTVLDLLAVPVPRGLDGRSLSQTLLASDARPAVRTAYSESLSPLYNHGWSDLRAVRDERARFVRAPRPELYDLARDPRELENLHEREVELASSYAERLATLLPQEEADVRGVDVRDMDPEVRESLAALGYVFTDDGDPGGGRSERVDPKDTIHVAPRMDAILELLEAKRFDEAESLWKTILEVDRGWYVLEVFAHALFLQGTGREREGLDLLREAAQMPGAPSKTLLNVARWEHSLGLDSWPESLERAKERDPRDPEPWAWEGKQAHERGDTAAAHAAYQKALELDERHALAWIGIGTIEDARGDRIAAEKALRRATESDPRSADAWFKLGVLCQESGRVEEAMTSYGEARELAPEDVRVLINMGGLHLASEKTTLAEECFEAALTVDRESFDANQNLGGLRMLQGRAPEAAECFLRATRARPDSQKAWFGRMRACQADGDTQASLEAAERLLELAPGDFLSLVTAALASEALGRSADAERYLKSAVERHAHRVDAQAGRDPKLKALLERLP